MRGLLKAIDGDRKAQRYIDTRKDVIRMGVATSSFYRDYPYVCERKNTTAAIGKLKEKIEEMQLLLKERSIQELKPLFEHLENLLEERENANFLKKRSVEKDIKSSIADLRSKTSMHEEYAHLLDHVDATNISTQFYIVRARLLDRDVPILSVTEYRDLSDSDIRKKIKDCSNEIQELKDYESTVKMRSAKIIGMTPHLLMYYRGYFMSHNGPDIDHIFVDEAGYANLIQMLPVFMIGAPVTFLGDHKQLAPVCELNDDDIKTWFRRDEPYMHYAYMWAVPALYSEYALSNQPDVIGEAYIRKKAPGFDRTATASLTDSFRFGPNLAKILDRCIYQNGIIGCGKGSLSIESVDARCEERGTVNLPEVQAISRYIDAHKKDLGSLVILTPYRDQVQALKNHLPPELKDDIMTVHKSQGREWDTVIISIRDNEYTSSSLRLTYTSTVKTPDGARVMNTAVSRAKKRLVIVCDTDFWANRVDDRELLRNLLLET